MDESMKEMFAGMFGEKKKDEAVIAVESEQVNETSPEQETETPSTEPETKPEAEVKSEDTDECADAKDIEKAKKELGMGGAEFCDEIIATCPDILTRLKEAGKTLHGLFNFSYSYMLDQYVKKHGRVDGGSYGNLSDLAEKYLDPSVKEGFTVSEPKVKKPSAPKPSSEVKATPAEIKKIAKKAAKAAKKKAEKDASDKSESSSESSANYEQDEKKIKLDFSSIDLSKIDFSKIKL